MQNRIKAVRSYYKMTQMQFGSKLGVKGNTITSYETGTRVPSDSIIMSICREFGINRAWLKSGEGEMLVETISRTLDRIRERYGASDIFRAMLDVYATMTSAQQDAFEEYINMLAQAVATGQNPATVRPSLPTEAEIAKSTATEDATSGKLAGD